MTVIDGLAKLPRDMLLQELVFGGHVTYSFQGNVSALEPNDLVHLAPSYLLSALSDLTSPELVKLLFLRPTVHVEKSHINTALKTTKIELKPLGNMVFTRDQQIVTGRGLVMGTMNSDQRRHETAVMKLFFEAVGIRPVCEVTGSGRLEGGDYIPVSSEMVLIGVGLRTNWEAVGQLLNGDCFGASTVAVVEDAFDQSQDRMHLDTVFNIADSNRVVILEDIIANKEMQRFVTLFSKQDGKYVTDGTKIEFSSFLSSHGFQC